MKTLFINACVRGESRTYRLAKKLLDRLGGYDEIDLEKSGPEPLNRERPSRRDGLLAAGEIGAPELFEARRFAEADVIVVAAPYWDLMFPALLKIYLENVTVCGVTFYYTDEGVPTGLCRAKRLYYVATAGGPVVKNFGYEYVDALAKGFYRISDTRLICAEGLDIYGADVEKILREAEREIENLDLGE